MRCLQALSSLILLASLSSAIEEDPAVVAARARQNQARTLIVEYRQHSRKTLAATANRPKMVISVMADNRLVIDGNKVRLEYHNPLPQNSVFLKHSQIEVFDGVRWRAHYPVGIGESPIPQGILLDEPPGVEVGMSPAVLTFRWPDPEFRLFRIDQFKPSGRVEAIDGVKCIAYEFPLRDSIQRCWLDPASNFVVRQVESERGGHITVRNSISYRNDPTAGWVPTGWRVEVLESDGSPTFVRECEVTRLVLNQPIDPNEFTIVFEPGTQVYDQKSKKQFYVLGGGDMREFTSSELNPTPPRTTIRQWISRHAWTLVLVASALLLCLTLLLLVRRMRPKTAQPRLAK